MANPTLEEHIEALSREFGETDIEDALLDLALRRVGGGDELLARVVDRLLLADSELLDAAATLAARHEGLSGEEEQLRSYLALFALRTEITRRVAGTPSQVLEDLGQSMVDQARIRGEVIRTVWREPMLTPGAAAVALGARKTNREKVRRHRERSWLVGLPSGGGYLYPAFQFDAERRDVFPEVRTVNERLDAAGDPWGVASWWISAHDRLGARPADLIGTDRAGDLLKAADAALEPIG